MSRAELVIEVALAISYNDINYAVMMVTPIALDDFILGFSLSENIISSAISLKDIEYKMTAMGIEANVMINERDFAALKIHRRQLSGRTGCGICGHEALKNLLVPAKPVAKSVLPDAKVFDELEPKLRDWQQYGKISGALHAAFFVSHSGEIKVCREDVGRHNALDKMIGYVVANKLDPSEGFVVMTSRCSYELIQKIARAEFPTLMCLSAPTTLAVYWAQQHNINLIHLTKKDAPRIYNRGD
ncbi:formate dehydrogenase accessory sulfurtransferase FdhD [Shewanella sp. VB17]|nr:formate dehydrogenase accessory sulfurtransferase FdhD [Shewanella sp. VB17]